jgi:hypothetical protein
MRIHTVFS